MADDLQLTEWLEQHIWPAERKFLNPEFVYEATLFAAAECLKCGVTCVNDMYLFAADVARACADAGLRAFVGEGVIDAATPSAATWRDGVRLTRELIAAYRRRPADHARGLRPRAIYLQRGPAALAAWPGRAARPAVPHPHERDLRRG